MPFHIQKTICLSPLCLSGEHIALYVILWLTIIFNEYRHKKRSTAVLQPLLTLNLILWKTHCKGTAFCIICKFSKEKQMFYNMFSHYHRFVNGILWNHSGFVSFWPAVKATPQLVNSSTEYKNIPLSSVSFPSNRGCRESYWAECRW